MSTLPTLKVRPTGDPGPGAEVRWLGEEAHAFADYPEFCRPRKEGNPDDFKRAEREARLQPKHMMVEGKLVFKYR